MRKASLLLFIVFSNLVSAQNNPNPGYWQQQADYKMDVFMDVKTFQYKGTQEIELHKQFSRHTSQSVLSFVF